MVSKDFVYQGSELAVFAKARNWKAYWGSKIKPYVGRRVLDVGAGAGATAHVLCGERTEQWLALEPDATLVQQLVVDKSAGLLPSSVEAKVGTLLDLDPQAVFDTILYIDVLEHIGDDRGELRRASAHLAPGGFLVVLVPAHQGLFTPFDAAIGHYRRYNKKSLLDLNPQRLRIEWCGYLDSAGLLASLGNRLFLRSSMPTAGQISVWDSLMVPISRVLDPMLANSIGKTALAVWRRPGDDA